MLVILRERGNFPQKFPNLCIKILAMYLPLLRFNIYFNIITVKYLIKSNLSNNEDGLGAESVNLEVGRVLYRKILSEPLHCWQRITVKFHFKSGLLLFKGTARLYFLHKEGWLRWLLEKLTLLLSEIIDTTQLIKCKSELISAVDCFYLLTQKSITYNN